SQTRVLISVNLYDEKGSPQAGKEITFQWDGGKETVTSNKDGVVRWPVKKERSKKLLLQLPAGTRASLGLVDQNGDELPSLPVDEIVKSAGGEIVKTIDGTLTSKDAIDRLRKKCHAQVH